jgi:hypothetical protein
VFLSIGDKSRGVRERFGDGVLIFASLIFFLFSREAKFGGFRPKWLQQVVCR